MINLILRQINKYFKEITKLTLRNHRFKDLLKKEEYMFHEIKTLKIIIIKGIYNSTLQM